MIQPLNGRVLIEPDEAKQETDFGFVLAEVKDKPATGTVLVGGEKVKEGQRVLFTKFGYDVYIENKKTLYVVSEDTLLAILD